jgi:CubicO group peptidase (beta-lactamase class C family)
MNNPLKLFHFSIFIFFAVISFFAGCITFYKVPHKSYQAEESKTFDTTYATENELARQKLIGLKKMLDLPAVSVSVGHGNKMIWSEALGYANLEKEKAVAIDTKFRIGSISKAVTSLAVGKLYQSGLLDLDAPVQRYVPYFPRKKYPISTRQLAGHMAGIRDYQWSLSFWPPHETYSNDQYDSVKEALNIFKDDPLEYEPQTRFEYSTYGYNLIGAVIEGASGTDYPAYMKNNVLEPLQMHNTTFDYQDRPVENKTSYYVSFIGCVLEAPEVNNSIKWAGGGLLSTPADLVKMGMSLLNNTFLEDSTINMMFTPQKLVTGEVNEQNYGIGWRIHSLKFINDAGTVDNYRVVHHAGTSAGGSSILLLFPDHKLVLAMLTNITVSDKQTFRNDSYLIAKIFLDKLRAN